LKHRAIFALLLACPAFAQQFEVASIKPFDLSAPGQVADGLHVDGAKIRATGLSVRDFLAIAYTIKQTLISGPDWTASERFDFSATMPSGGTAAQIPAMIQALLADRFQVKTHRDRKDFPVYALLVGKDGSKMKINETPSGSDDQGNVLPGIQNSTATRVGLGVSVNYGHGSSYTFAHSRFEAHKLAMPLFAANLERFADRPIVDMTGLTGQYDFAFDVMPEDYIPMLLRIAVWGGTNLPPEAQKLLDASSPAALGDALQQIGLKLDARNAPLDVLVIDYALKTPTVN
jgi:uncharacterized protein (TIGR03435 family)